MLRNLADRIEWGESLSALARRMGTPLYIYDAEVVRDRLAELRHGISCVGRPWHIHYAMKANRHPGILRAVRAEGDIGIDASSPREIALALDAGFTPDEISVTSSMPSDRDLTEFARAGAHVNLDTLSSIRRYGALAPPGSRIGLRLDPEVAIGWRGDSRMAYGKGKFGFDEPAVAAALDAARAAGLEVDTLHMHCGWNIDASAIDGFEAALALLARIARQVPVRTVNVGGGLGVRFLPGDQPLSPRAWAGALRRHLGGLDCAIACEPGTFVVAEAGVLIVEVNTVEQRRDTVWVGVDAGHNINPLAAHYGVPLRIAAVGRVAEPARRYTVAGNINEAIDIFARDVALPEIREGDLLALFPAGAYGSSMASDHCLRGRPNEAMLA
ncbi:MAG: hypothetical protein M0006_05775 [Magnetospirillum sp.]|nr:hypothetical protein [Magnetospirillum sp.]